MAGAPAARRAVADPAAEAAAILAELETLGSAENRAGMARFGIAPAKAFGVPMTALRAIARRYRRDHPLAAALWAAGAHETRILACLLDEPAKVTPAQMDGWAGDFDSWALCDGACLHLFPRTPHADGRIRAWAEDGREYVRRAAFALIAGLSVHGKALPDAAFLSYLELIERHAADPRNFVRKAVNWALRQIGKRSPALHGPALALAEKLAQSADRAARWIGRDAARELADPQQRARVAQRPRR